MRVASVSKQGLLETRRLQTSLRIAEPLRRARDPYPTITQPSDAKRPFIDQLSADVAKETILAIVGTEGPTTRSRLLRQVASAADQIVAEVTKICDLAITQLVASGELYLVEGERADHPGACFAVGGTGRMAMRQRGEREVWEVPTHELNTIMASLLDEYVGFGALPVEAQISSDLAFVLDVPDWSFDAVILSAAVSLALEDYQPPDVPVEATPVVAMAIESDEVANAPAETSVAPAQSQARFISRLRFRWSRGRAQQ
jgi:hypothetical protein